MIVRLLGFAVRCLCELAALLLISGVLALVLAFRLTRRLVKDRPGSLDRILELGVPPAVLAAIILWGKASSARAGQGVDSGAE